MATPEQLNISLGYLAVIPESTARRFKAEYIYETTHVNQVMSCVMRVEHAFAKFKFANNVFRLIRQI